MLTSFPRLKIPAGLAGAGLRDISPPSAYPGPCHVFSEGAYAFSKQYDCREVNSVSMRKWLASFGAGMIVLHLVFAGSGSSAMGFLRQALTDQRLISASVSVELGGSSPAVETPAPPELTIHPLPISSTPKPVPTPEIIETSITGSSLIENATDYDPDIAQLLAEGPQLRLQRDEPQILIIHTHSSEAYTMDAFDTYEPSDSYRTQDATHNVIRLGDILAERFAECGLTVIHDQGVYDYPSYTGSYSRAGAAIESYLAQYPSISIVIDLHRDAIGDNDVIYKTKAEGEANPSAQAMLVVGTNASGLEHPHWEENLKLALYLQSAVNPTHPTLMRPVTLTKERYNQQLTTGSLILEVGSNGNTLQEAITAVRLFADGAGPALAKLITD